MRDHNSSVRIVKLCVHHIFYNRRVCEPCYRRDREWRSLSNFSQSSPDTRSPKRCLLTRTLFALVGHRNLPQPLVPAASLPGTTGFIFVPLQIEPLLHPYWHIPTPSRELIAFRVDFCGFDNLQKWRRNPETLWDSAHFTTQILKDFDWWWSVDQLMKKLKLKLGFFLRIKSYLYFVAKKRLVSATFITVLDYSDVIYMHASSQRLHSLVPVNGASRFITNLKAQVVLLTSVFCTLG